MNQENIAFSSALTLSKLIHKKDISPLELTEIFLTRIEKFDRQLNSFSYVATEEALHNAKEKTEQLGKTKDTTELPLFFGIPTAIKDLYHVQGMPCSYGNFLLKNNISNQDEAIATRIKEAGFIILGKTTTSEFGTLPYIESEQMPPTRNPYNLDYTAGGSSGGSAAAIAAGLIPIAPASDGGGSVRGPAFCCGLVGLKPSRGRISNAPVGDYQGGIGTHGCLTRDVLDNAALLDIMAGYVTGDPYWLENPDISFLQSTAQKTDQLKIAFAPSLRAMAQTAPVMQQQVTEIVTLLATMGHTLTEDCPNFSALIAPFTLIWQSGVAMSSMPDSALNPMNQWLKNNAPQVGQYLQAVHQMQVISRQIVAFFDDFDVLILPTYLQPPIKIGLWQNTPPEETLSKIIDWIAPCPPFNATGQPAIAIPTGLSEEGLPIGVQLIGKPKAEATILKLAYHIEQTKQLKLIPAIQEI